ncbi:MAG: M14 family zinc carboxypeptidase [Bacteroidales bacterium]
MRHFILSAFLLIFSYNLNAQIDFNYYLEKDCTTNPEIPAPGELSGHIFGEWHFSHDQVVHYLKRLSEKSDRVKMVEYGRTHENRPLYHLIISSPENIANMDKIRENHLQYIYSKESTSNPDDNPIIIWLGYGVHGNESSATNASLLTAYYLLSSEEEQVEEYLNEAVFIIDPSLNPDGFNRAASWVNMHQSKNRIDDQSSIQFSEYWPGGRTNHYWFDLNRDWLLVQHPESKARVTEFHRWKPAVVSDHHEMGTNGTFFFQPGVPTRNNAFTPSENYDLTYKMGQYHSKALDKIGSLYFSEEVFDDFYYGKGSTYPDVNGAIGILFEQSRVNGQVVNNIHGTTTFAEAIRNQFTVSLSTINAAIENKEELKSYQRSFYQSAKQLADKDKVKGYAFGNPEDPMRVQYMLQVLNTHQIDIYHNRKKITVGGTNFDPNEAFIVPTTQNQYRLIKSLFEKNNTYEDSIFYDISSWNFPMTFNIDYQELENAGSFMGERVTSFEIPQGTINGQSSIGYVFNWSNYHSPKVLYRLMEKDVRVKVATKPLQLKINGAIKDFGYGSIFIPVNKQTVSSDDLYSIIQKIGEEEGIDIFGLDHGFRYSGIHLGSYSFRPVEKPGVLLLTGNGIRSYEAGEIWHLLDHRMDIPVTRVDIDRLNRIDLFDYNTLIISSGNIRFSDSDSKKIEVWLENGGTLITLGNAVTEAGRQEWIQPNIRKREKQDTTLRLSYASASDQRRANSINGVILEAQIDQTHPIGYGYNQSTLPVFKNSGFVLEKSNNPYATPVFIAKDDILLSGYTNDRNLEYLANSAYVVTWPVGRGKVIAFADDPNFRGIWYGTNKLFLNAIFFGGL